MIAHQIVAPVLDEITPKVWRFHRRYDNDPAGHMFRFMFYSNDEVGEKLSLTVLKNGLLQEMKDAGYLLKATHEPPSSSDRAFESTSDEKEWSQSVCRTWPYYIHGVSQMWLELIKELVGEYNHTSLDQTINNFKRINSEITELWEKEGGHALLHHLSAVFGQEPVQIVARIESQNWQRGRLPRLIL